MTFSRIWNGILSLNKEVDTLDKEVEVLKQENDKELLEGKRSLFVEVKEFDFVEDDLTYRSSPLVQSVEGVTFIESLSVNVFVSNPDFGNAAPQGVTRFEASPTAWGYIGGVAGNGNLAASFDFKWNYRLGSSGISYAQSLKEGVTFCGRQALGFIVNTPSNKKYFDRPLFLKEHEFLTMEILPTRYTLPGPFKRANTVYTIAFTVSGYKLLGVHT
jgi:hypothetical protein